MKTHREIQEEARRLEQLGWQYWNERRAPGANALGATASDTASRLLLALPDSRFTTEHFGSEPIHTHCRSRRIEVALDGDAPEFRLLQDEIETTASGSVVREIGPVLMLRSDSAADVLEDGYELGEEERLGELLAPFADRIEEMDLVDEVDPALVERIEGIVDAGNLAPAARLRCKMDIAEFLEGRLESSQFITAAIERQVYRESEREALVERQDARLLMDQP